MKKQMQYANKKNVKYVLLIGEDEITNNSITIKNMNDGSQDNVTFKQLLSILK